MFALFAVFLILHTIARCITFAAVARLVRYICTHSSYVIYSPYVVTLAAIAVRSVLYMFFISVKYATYFTCVMLVEVDMFAAVAIFSTFAKLDIRHLLLARLSELFWAILEHPSTSWEALGTPGEPLGRLLKPSWKPFGGTWGPIGRS